MATIAQIVPQEELERLQRLAKRQFDSWQNPGGSSIDEDERVARNVHPHVLSILDELLAARAALAATPAPAAPQVAGVGVAPANYDLSLRAMQALFTDWGLADCSAALKYLLRLAATPATPEAAPLGGWVAKVAELQKQLAAMERNCQEFEALCDFWKAHRAEGMQEPSIAELIKEGYLRPAPAHAAQ